MKTLFKEHVFESKRFRLSHVTTDDQYSAFMTIKPQYVILSLKSVSFENTLVIELSSQLLIASLI